MLRASELPQEERDLSSPSVISQAYGPPTAREDGANTTIEWKVNETDLIRWTSQPIGRIEDGSTIKVEFFRSGRLHRDDGPAVASFNAGGRLRRAQWWSEGQMHRTNGPADQEWDWRGALVCESWRRKDSRISGPTEVRYDRGRPTVFTYEGHRSDVTAKDERTRRLHQAAITGRATARTEAAAGARPRRPTATALTPQSTHYL